MYDANTKTLLIHDDDEGSYESGDYEYGDESYEYCPSCGYDAYFPTSSGWYYTPYFSYSLTSNQSYDFFIAPHSFSSYRGTYKSFILISNTN